MSRAAKVAWWFVADLDAPSWVSRTLAAIWAILVYGNYKRHGLFDWLTLYCVFMMGTRIAMAIFKERDECEG